MIYFTAPTLLFFQLIGAKAQLIPICYVDNSLLNSFDYNTKLSFDLPVGFFGFVDSLSLFLGLGRDVSGNGNVY